jgi:hypothetical protein
MKPLHPGRPAKQSDETENSLQIDLTLFLAHIFSERHLWDLIQKSVEEEENIIPKEEVGVVKEICKATTQYYKRIYGK